MKNLPHNEFIREIKTVKEMKDILGKLSEIGAESFSQNGSFEKKIAAIFRPDEADAFFAICKEEGVSLSNPVAVSALVNRLTSNLHSLFVVKMDLAILPTKDTVNAICSWFEEKLGVKIILDVTVNPDILAGFEIEIGGFYKDCTIRQKLDSIVNIAHE